MLVEDGRKKRLKDLERLRRRGGWVSDGKEDSTGEMLLVFCNATKLVFFVDAL